MPMLDYLGGDLAVASAEERVRHIEAAKQQSLSFLFWMQTEAPHHDGGGWPGLRLRRDVTNSLDGLAKAPYIRESRRAKTEFAICEQHVSAEPNPGATRAVQFNDSVGIGYYRIDLHPTTGGDNYVDVAALPFQIPLGALIPVRIENLIPAAKNIGTTHITNGCYRLHPVEWNIGESAGALAAFCLDRNVSPRAVRNNQQRLTEFQQRLMGQGVELAWPADLNLEEGDPHAHAR
ncbi:MAG: FAD-dependent oxidoreductase [Pyrinomonadaceae bacterium]